MKKQLFLISMTIMAMFCYAQDVTVFVLSPPEKELPGVEKISIMNFKGDKGKLLADYMTSFLMQDERGIHDLSGNLFSKGTEGKTYLKGARTNVFSLVERTEIDKVLQEQNLSNSGLIDDTQAAEIGKILGSVASELGPKPMISGISAYPGYIKQLSKLQGGHLHFGLFPGELKFTRNYVIPNMEIGSYNLEKSKVFRKAILGPILNHYVSGGAKFRTDYGHYGKKLLDNQEVRMQLGKQGRRWAKQNSWPAVAAKQYKFYESVLEVAHK